MLPSYRRFGDSVGEGVGRRMGGWGWVDTGCHGDHLVEDNPLLRIAAPDVPTAGRPTRRRPWRRRVHTAPALAASVRRNFSKPASGTPSFMTTAPASAAATSPTISAVVVNMLIRSFNYGPVKIR